MPRLQDSDQTFNEMKKFGLLGGTFNPVHLAHLQVATDAQRICALDRIYFIPSALPPHKPTHALAAASHRLAMLQCALADQPSFRISDVELRRSGLSYTIDTIHYFLEHKCAPDEKISFVIGRDAFLEIHTWHRFLQLFELVGFVVMDRPGTLSDNGPKPSFRMQVAHFLEKHISTGYHYAESRNAFEHKGKQTVHLCPVTPLRISSSDIRRRLQSGKSIADRVPKAVADYIRAKGLYQ